MEALQINNNIVESLVLQGDISKMQPSQKVDYYKWLCDSLGLNPATQPFQIIKFQGKEILYAKKDATDQLRKIHKVSVFEKSIDTAFADKGIYVVNVKVQDGTGRTDIGTGAVVMGNQSGEALANLIMKAETKAKRRATLSICGLGMLDESELDTMPPHTVAPVNEVNIIPMKETPKRDFMEETKDIDTKEKYVEWEKTLVTEEDRKAAYNVKAQVQLRLTRLNIEKVIDGIKKSTSDKTIFTIDNIISEEKDKARKEELIEKYNKMLELRGFDHRYEKTPFED